MQKYLIAAGCVVAGVLAGCASTADNEQTAQEPNPCLGVQPAVGTMIVRKADCGGEQQSAGPGSGQGVPAQMQRR